jgi:hypothetical protein
MAERELDNFHNDVGIRRVDEGTTKVSKADVKERTSRDDA